MSAPTIPGHTYRDLMKRLRSHFEQHRDSAGKGQRGIWDRQLELLDAYDVMGPWPDLPRIADVSREDAAAEWERYQQASADYQAYWAAANAELDRTEGVSR